MRRWSGFRDTPPEVHVPTRARDTPTLTCRCFKILC